MGRFVVIEGLDGAGTTTQVARLAARLRGADQAVVQTFEPTDGPIGRIARSVLRQEAGAPTRAALPWIFAADRADHLTRTVEPALLEGAWVVSDRYYHSSLAYQSLERPLEEVDALNRAFRAPDLTVFLTLDVDTCLDRISNRGGTREIYEVRDQLERIAGAYEKVNELLRGRGEAIVDIDASLSIDDVHDAVWRSIAELG